jgi:hypothetical protein
MKKFILLSAFALTTCLTFGQDISDVSQSGNYLIVRGEKNNQISSKYMGSNDELCGFSSTIIVVKSGNYAIVYDQKFSQISSKYMGSNDKVKNVSGNNIILKSGNYVITYDKKWSQISSRYE